MSEQETKKVNPEDEGRLVTADEILLGGEEGLTRLELKSVVKDGKPGVVYLKQLPAKDVIAFSLVPKEDQVEAMAPLIGKAVCNEEGTRIFTDEKARELVDVSISVFSELSLAITGTMKKLSAKKQAEGDIKTDAKDELGEDSGEATGSASPTNSQAN